MTDRILLDSTNPPVVAAVLRAGVHFHGLPPTMAAGYVDGMFSWGAPGWSVVTKAGIHPSQQIAITVFGQVGTTPVAKVADVEPGDLDPQGGAAWALGKHNRNSRPTLYVNRANKAAVIAACRTKGLAPGKDYSLWVATLDGSLNDFDGTPLRSEPGVVAIQFLGAAAAGFNVDVSLVTDPKWVPAAVPVTPPAAGTPTLRLADGTKSLRAALRAYGMTLDEGLWLMAVHKGHGYGRLQGPYINAEKYGEPMPAGMVFWTAS